MSNGVRARRSIFPGLLLIVIGLLFFLHQIYPGFSIGHLARIYWPFLFILWGIAKLIDHVAAHSAGQARPSLLSGGEAALLILLVLVLLTFIFRDWVRDRFPGLRIDIAPFQHSYTQSRELAAQAIPPGAHVTIESGHGDIAVHAAAADELRAGVNESATGSSESAAGARMKKVAVEIEQTAGGYTIRPAHQSDFEGTVSVDLDVQVPKSASLTLRTSHGDVSASGVSGAIDARTESGDIEIHDVGSDVAAQTEKGDVRISRVAGNVTLKGRGEDVEIADVTGDVMLDGAFTGSLIVRKVEKTARLVSPWADLTVAQLTGQLEADSGDFKLSGVAGAAKIQTHNKDITVDNVAGPLDVVDSHGDIQVGSSVPPHEPIDITDDSGEVELTLPAKSSFQIAAFSRQGEVDCDFEDPSLKTTGGEKDGRLDGHYGGKSGTPGPKITITTSYGTIALHKST